MDQPRRPRTEPRLVFVVVMLAIPVLIFVTQTILVRGDECADPERRDVGGLSQLFVPGVGCERDTP